MAAELKTLFPWARIPGLRRSGFSLGKSRSPCQHTASQPALCPVSAVGSQGPVSGMTVSSLSEDRRARANFLQNRLLGRKPEGVARGAQSQTRTVVPRRSPARLPMISIREGHPDVRALPPNQSQAQLHVYKASYLPGILHIPSQEPPLAPGSPPDTVSSTHGSVLQGQLLPRTFTPEYSSQSVC